MKKILLLSALLCSTGHAITSGELTCIMTTECKKIHSYYDKYFCAIYEKYREISEDIRWNRMRRELDLYKDLFLGKIITDLYQTANIVGEGLPLEEAGSKISFEGKKITTSEAPWKELEEAKATPAPSYEEFQRAKTALLSLYNLANTLQYSRKGEKDPDTSTKIQALKDYLDKKEETLFHLVATLERTKNELDTELMRHAQLGNNPGQASPYVNRPFPYGGGAPAQNAQVVEPAAAAAGKKEEQPVKALQKVAQEEAALQQQAAFFQDVFKNSAAKIETRTNVIKTSEKIAALTRQLDTSGAQAKQASPTADFEKAGKDFLNAHNALGAFYAKKQDTSKETQEDLALETAQFKVEFDREITLLKRKAKEEKEQQ